MRKRISIMLLLCILGLLLCACAPKSDEDLIEERISTFLKAYNTGDMEAAIECFDAKTRNTYKSLMNLGEGLLGMTGLEVGIADMFGLSVGLLSDGDMLQFSNMKVELLSDTQATVSVTAYYESIEERYSEEIQFSMRKEDGDWFIDQ